MPAAETFPSLQSLKIDRATVVAYSLIFLAYFLTAKLGLYLYTVVGSPFAVPWLPVGIAAASVILFGYRIWPAVFLAQFVAILTQPDWGFTFAFISAAAYSLQAVLTWYALQWAGFRPQLDVVRNVLLLIGASFVLTLVGPSIVALFLIGAHLSLATLVAVEESGWAAGIFSMLVGVPFILSWYPLPPVSYRSRDILEISAAFVLLMAINALLFWTPYAGLFGIAVIFFLPAVLIWFALRFHPRWLTLGIFATSVVSFVGEMLVHPSPGPLSAELVAIEIYVGLVAAIYYVFVAVVDERRAASEAMKIAIEELQHQDEAKNEFIGILAHELRNPLAPVVSTVELMRMHMVQGRPIEPQLVENISSHVSTITHLLDDLLDIARITRKEFKLQHKPVELQALAAHCKAAVDYMYSSRRHTLVVSLPAEPLWLNTDPVRLEQIIVNLLTNAAKYTEPGGKIFLNLVYDDERGLRVSVQDNGIGIEPHMLTKIFEPFVRVSRTSARAGTGLGIGLSLTKYLVELQGGRIWAESNGLGAGSEFIVVLPLQRIAAPVRSRTGAAQSARLEQWRGGRHTVLVVDDNQPAATTLAVLLEGSGQDVAVVYDGQSAIKHMETHGADVVLLDIGLPDVDGYAVARRLRELYGKAPVFVALTGYGQEEDKAKAINAGFDYHLTKPVSIEDIRAILMRYAPARA